ncbi:MAG: phosphatidate cytidylyltransferase [Firmicutes bacterium]|nr:phosphatidate cytidylyltransferase [Bacillota bacterium]
MLKRTISAIIALPLLFYILLTGGPVLKIATFVVSIIGLFEFYRAFSKKEKPISWVGYAMTILLFLGFFGDFSKDYFTFVVSLGLFTLLGLVVFSKGSLNGAMITFTGFFYVAFSLSHMILISDLDDNFFIWYPFIIAFLSDTFAYLTGKLLGKTKLIPSVSPNKTVEGSLGGVIGSVLFSFLFAMVFKPEFQFYAIIMGLTGSILSQIGDLIASKIKRLYDIKDFGNIMPGHGGVLDRFDSVIVTLPLVYYFMILFHEINSKLV